VTFDIYPEQSDEPPRPPVDRDLESLLGEVARDDKSGGLSDEPLSESFAIPWLAIGYGLLIFLGAGLVGGYGIKTARRFGMVSSYRTSLDRLADIGETRSTGETRTAYARRLREITPSFEVLTERHLRQVYRGSSLPAQELGKLSAKVHSELRKSLPLGRRILALLNPIGWWFSR
jgi:hypothetical protein